MKLEPWCIRHTRGWCIAKDQKHEPEAGNGSLPTACDHFITLNFGVERRKPTGCQACWVHYAGLQVDEERKAKRDRRRVTPV